MNATLKFFTSFGELHTGDTFVHKGLDYIKVQNAEVPFNAVRMVDGFLDVLEDSSTVTPTKDSVFYRDAKHTNVLPPGELV